MSLLTPNHDDVFEVEPFCDDTALVDNSAVQNGITGKITCSTRLKSLDGRNFVVIGCTEGVWVGQDSRSLRRVFHLKMVTQCAMLDEHGVFLVLADKVLYAYHIQALVPSSAEMTIAMENPQRLGTRRASDVEFFRVGKQHNKTLVTYCMQSKDGTDSIFRVVEALIPRLSEQTLEYFGSQNGARDWFRVFRSFFSVFHSHDLAFLETKLVLMHKEGFEVLDPNDFRSFTLPRKDDSRYASLAERWSSAVPLLMVKCTNNEFLLCYSNFGIYVDQHGDPNRLTSIVEWKGTAKQIALHRPYILLFDPSFIEVRHIETGRLVQTIPGDNIRCLWDGINLNISANSPDGLDSEVRIHAVKSVVDPASGATIQRVFELVPKGLFSSG